MSIMDNIEFTVDADSEDIDLLAGDFRDTEVFEEGFRRFVSELGADEVVTVSLLPPFGGRFAAPGAVDIALKVIASMETPPRVRLVVDSDKAIEMLRPRLDRSERETKSFDVGELSVEIALGDITEVEVDAIVNPSNNRLELGSGVSGAIRRNADSALQDRLTALAERRQLRSGHVIVTDSYGLPATKKILHTPTASTDLSRIERTIKNCLRRANSEDFESLAIPALGTGVGGLDMRELAQVLLAELKEFGTEEHTLERVVVIVWTGKDFETMVEEAEAIF